MDYKSLLAPVSKAVAGSLVAILIAVLAHYDIRLGGEHKDAIELLINGGVAAALGFLVVFAAPKNKGQL